VGKIAKKSSLKECVKIQCYIVKIHSYRLLFWLFLPTELLREEIEKIEKICEISSL